MNNNTRQLKKYKAQIEINKHNAFGYKRVSDLSQVERSSLDTQDIHIRKYCQDNNLNLLKIFADEGKSGLTTDGRDGFTDLVEEIQPGNFLIVYELSRLSRKQTTVLVYIQDLVENKGCTFICLSPLIDSRDPSATLMLGIYSTVFQEESKRTGTRVKANMQRLSEEGKLLCRPPFGYVHDDDTRKYVPDEEQQAVVQKIKMMHICGVNQSEITTRLNNEGLGHVLNNNKTKKISNPTFSRTTVNIILQNYGFIKDEKSPQYTYPQRVENWNQSLVNKKKKAKKQITSSVVTTTTTVSTNM